jgi:excisionase family DNA binding protein
MKYYTAAEAAKAFNVSKVTIIRWIQSGKLKAEQEGSGRGGGEYRIPESEIPKEKLNRMQNTIEGKAEIVTNDRNVSELVTMISKFSNLSQAISHLPKIAETLERIAASLEKLQSLPTEKKEPTKKQLQKKPAKKKPTQKTNQKKPARKPEKKNKRAKK